MSKYIDDEEKFKFFQRLIDPYTKKNVKRFFINQYLNGDGNELKSKFWSKKSSSRFAFDLYSWLAKDPNVLDFQFEFKLPGMASGGKTPNMDVFIETENKLIFIESKFSELADWKYMSDGGLSEAYWLNAPYGSKQMSLVERYHGCECATHFRDFIIEFDAKMKTVTRDGNEWFYAKQETCHLIGIALYLHLNPSLKSKKVCLYNIVWNLKGDKFPSDLSKAFDGLLDKYQQKLFAGVNFEYKTFSAQSLLANGMELDVKVGFPDEVRNLIDPFEKYSENCTRSDMKKK